MEYMNFDRICILEILLDITRLFKSIFFTTLCKESSCGDCRYKEICESLSFTQDCIYELLGEDD